MAVREAWPPHTWNMCHDRLTLSSHLTPHVALSEQKVSTFKCEHVKWKSCKFSTAAGWGFFGERLDTTTTVALLYKPPSIFQGRYWFYFVYFEKTHKASEKLNSTNSICLVPRLGCANLAERSLEAAKKKNAERIDFRPNERRLFTTSNFYFIRHLELPNPCQQQTKYLLTSIN